MTPLNSKNNINVTQEVNYNDESVLELNQMKSDIRTILCSTILSIEQESSSAKLSEIYDISLKLQKVITKPERLAKLFSSFNNSNDDEIDDLTLPVNYDSLSVEDSFVKMFGDDLSTFQNSVLELSGNELDLESDVLSQESVEVNNDNSFAELYDSGLSDAELPPSPKSPLSHSHDDDFDVETPTSTPRPVKSKPNYANRYVDPKDDKKGCVFAMVIKRENQEDTIFIGYTKRLLSVRLKEIARRAASDVKNKTPMEKALDESYDVSVSIIHNKKELKGIKLCKDRTALAHLVSPYKNSNVLNCWKQKPGDGR